MYFNSAYGARRHARVDRATETERETAASGNVHVTVRLWWTGGGGGRQDGHRDIGGTVAGQERGEKKINHVPSHASGRASRPMRSRSPAVRARLRPVVEEASSATATKTTTTTPAAPVTGRGARR